MSSQSAVLWWFGSSYEHKVLVYLIFDKSEKVLEKCSDEKVAYLYSVPPILRCCTPTLVLNTWMLNCSTLTLVLQTQVLRTLIKVLDYNTDVSSLILKVQQWPQHWYPSVDHTRGRTRSEPHRSRHCHLCRTRLESNQRSSGDHQEYIAFKLIFLFFKY